VSSVLLLRCRSATAESFDMSELVYADHLVRYEHTLQLLTHCRRGEHAAISQLLQPSNTQIIQAHSYVHDARTDTTSQTLSPNTRTQMFVDTNGYSTDQRETPLTATIRFNHFQAFTLLLAQKSVDINKCVCPYHIGAPASSHGGTATARAGTFSTMHNSVMCSPLHLAAKLGRFRFVLSLLKHGAGTE
jgi:ankyrin repeat protein